MKTKYLCTLLLGIMGAQFLLAQGIVLTNDLVTLALDAQGWSTQLVERATGRILADGHVPFVRPCGPTGAALISTNLTLRTDQTFVWSYRDAPGEVALRLEPFAGGWTFVVAQCSVPGVTRLNVGCLRGVRCWRYASSAAEAVSDNLSGIAIRPYDLRPSGYYRRDVYATLTLPAGEKWGGQRVGFAAGPREAWIKALQEMTKVSGFPYSTAGGAWALTSVQTKGSYLNANVTAASVDDWIDLASRGGFDVIHFREHWYAWRGHYPVNTNDWPQGLADMKKAVAKIHAAGLRAGLHTLTGCIDPRDSWITPRCSHDLMAWRTYTLAAPLAKGDTELRVCECPDSKHDVTFTYHGSGNAIRLGDEIIQYTGIRRTPPYAFTGVTRGAFGTVSYDHAQGEQADYLQQRYIAFYPKPDSPLARELAAAIGQVYRTCGFDQIYCDGAEGMFNPYAQAKMRNLILSECTKDGRACLTEDSAGGSGPACWWFHSRVGAWDSTYWAPKRFHDFHVARMLRDDIRARDLREIQMGWWCPVAWSPHARAHAVDEMEYYAGRNAALNASMSIAGCDGLSRGPLDFNTEEQMTVLGWYERFRRAGAFTRDFVQCLGVPRAEYRLRQNTAGLWQASAVTTLLHRVDTPAHATWQVPLTEQPQESFLRIEALYGGKPYTDAQGLTMIAATAPKTLAVTTASEQVTAQVATQDDVTKGRVLVFSAQNKGTSAYGAWAAAACEYRPYRAVGSRRVVAFWVKGDGSGALLNVQVKTPREYGLCYSEHYVKLDFTGWRYMEMPFRETDAEEYCNHLWPYTGGYAEVFHRVINMNQVSSVSLYLNEVPPQGSTRVCVTDVRLVPMMESAFDQAVLHVNGVPVPIPFALRSGEFAEYGAGYWTHLDKNRQPRARVAAHVPIPLRAGTNTFDFVAKRITQRTDWVWNKETPLGAWQACLANEGVRAEVNVFACGAKRDVLRDLRTLSSEAQRLLAYEAVQPCLYAPSRGFDILPPLVMRPGEKADVQFTVVGPISPFVLTIGEESHSFPAVAAGQVFRSPQHVFAAKSGCVPVTISADEESCARFSFVKYYTGRVTESDVQTFTVRPSDSLDEVLTRVSSFRTTAKGMPYKRVEVVLEPGVYELPQPIVLPVGLSGTPEVPTIIRSADPHQSAQLSGGRRITDWQVDEQGVWYVKLPEVKKGTWNFTQLYVNGQRRYRPVLPETGFYTTLSNIAATATTIGGFQAQKGVLRNDWANPEDLELQILHTWSVTRARIGRIDTARDCVYFAEPRKGNSYHCNFLNRRYRVENVREAFTKPGQWYLDRPSGVLAYRPLPGEDPATAEVVAPCLNTVVVCAGTEAEKIHHVEWRDVVFAHQQWITPRAGNFAVQAAFNVPAAVVLSNATDVTFTRCGFYHHGGYAVAFEKGATACILRDSCMADLGGGGVIIGPFVSDPDGRGHITVENCHITDGGHIFPAAVGVLIGRSSYNRVLHNEIDHLYYTGVSVGWNWDANSSKAHHNEVAFNHIHDIGQGLLSDMGLVYLLGRAPGTTVHDNFLHDIVTAQYGGTGIYPDEGSSELKIYNNVVLNTVRGYHQNYGVTNEVYNNVFINAREMQYDYRPAYRYNGITTKLHHNIFVWKQGDLMARSRPFGHVSKKDWEAWNPPYFGGLESYSNLYYQALGAPIRFGKKQDFAAVQQAGLEAGSICGSPKFVGDVWSGDVTLDAHSPAHPLGIKPLDICTAGLSDPAALPPFSNNSKGDKENERN